MLRRGDDDCAPIADCDGDVPTENDDNFYKEKIRMKIDIVSIPLSLISYSWRKKEERKKSDFSRPIQ